MSMWHNNVGYVVLQQGRFADSVEWFSRAVKLDPTNRRAQGNLGAALRWLGDMEVGLKLKREVLESELRDLAAALRRDPRDAEAHRLRAGAFAQLGRLDEADESSVNAIEIDPGSPGAWLERVEVLVCRGAFDEARGALEEAVRLDPNRTETLTQQAWLAAVTEDPSFAGASISTAHEREPHDWQLWEGLGWSAAARRDWREAERWFRQRVETDRQRCCSAAWLGFAYHERGAHGDAVRMLDHAIKANPGCTEIPRLRQRLGSGERDAGRRPPTGARVDEAAF